LWLIFINSFHIQPLCVKHKCKTCRSDIVIKIACIDEILYKNLIHIGITFYLSWAFYTDLIL